jgi:polyphosphate kinase 2 (PPK2 family)
VLVALQGLDAAGKDGVIAHVMSGINPQGCEVHSFKRPSPEELDHNFLWRVAMRLPERGRIGIFNRSHYEEVLVVRVHPDLLKRQKLPPELIGKDVWKERFKDIRGGAVAGVVGIEGGVVSEVINLESSGVEAPDRRPRHEQHYHED